VSYHVGVELARDGSIAVRLAAKVGTLPVGEGGRYIGRLDDLVVDALRWRRERAESVQERRKAESLLEILGRPG
jgi:hypothetical protein